MTKRLTVEERAQRQSDLERCRAILYGSVGLVGSKDSAFLLGILNQHPDAATKIGVGIEQFSVRWSSRFPGRREFWLTRLDGTETDWSFTKAVNGAPSHETLVRLAMRYEVIPQVEQFKHRGVAAGAHCAVTGDGPLGPDCHVDHHEPSFEVLAESFIDAHGGYDAFGITASTDGLIGRRLTDPFLASEWREFHREHAHLRLVTAHANLTKKRKL